MTRRRLAMLLAAAFALAGCAGPGTGTDTAAGASAPRYRNPILYADYSDPDVIRVGGDYYLVASSFHFSPGIPVLHSKDLVHWRILGHVLDRLPFDPAYDMPGPVTLTDATSKPVGRGLRYAGGVWAPAIRYHDGRFRVFWATPDEGIFMSSAANPGGPWTAPVTVLAGAGYEDPCPFWDDDGRAWLVHSKVGAGPLILHAMRPDGSGVLDEGRLIVEDKVNLPVLEGPKLVKKDGWYYIFAPIGGVGTGPQAVLRARRIDGPYEHRTVLKPGNGL
jgi:beta-xylosidase